MWQKTETFAMVRKRGFKCNSINFIAGRPEQQLLTFSLHVNYYKRTCACPGFSANVGRSTFQAGLTCTSSPPASLGDGNCWLYVQVPVIIWYRPTARIAGRGGLLFYTRLPDPFPHIYISYVAKNRNFRNGSETGL